MLLSVAGWRLFLWWENPETFRYKQILFVKTASMVTFCSIKVLIISSKFKCCKNILNVEKNCKTISFSFKFFVAADKSSQKLRFIHIVIIMRKHDMQGKAH